MTSLSVSYRSALMAGRGLALALLFATANAAYAQPPEAPYAGPDGRIGLKGKPCHSLSDCDRRDYDYSGTRGRMGLGADPAHPEGPGNAPN